LVRRSNFWRDNYNPMRGLTIAWLMARFEQAERGSLAEVQLLLRKAEKRFPVLKGFVEKLLAGVAALDGKVRVKEQLPPGATPAMAERQRRFLQDRYDLLRNFKTALGQLALAEIRGYAVLQKHRYRDGRHAGAVEELYWIEPWCWARDGYYGDFYYNENSQLGVGLGSCQSILGEACRLGGGQLPRSEFVIREVESPLYEIALIAFANWLMARKNYAAFTEIFGLPSFVVIMPPELAPGREAEYAAAAERVTQGSSGTLPAGTDVKFPARDVRGESPFGDFCDAQERDVVLAGTGGQLTMLSAPTGLGKGASEEHDAAWQKIAVTKAVQINDVLQRDFDLPELAAEFPEEPVCVEFALEVKDGEDVGLLLDNVVKAEGVGLQTDAAEISERSGLKLVRLPSPAGAGEGARRADEGRQGEPISSGAGAGEGARRAGEGRQGDPISSGAGEGGRRPDEGRQGEPISSGAGEWPGRGSAARLAAPEPGEGGRPDEGQGEAPIPATRADQTIDRRELSAAVNNSSRPGAPF
jgi:phage gp29-like protein